MVFSRSVHFAETLMDLISLTISRRKIFLTAIFKLSGISAAYLHGIKGQKSSKEGR
jgi:hypothetical protein